MLQLSVDVAGWPPVRAADNPGRCAAVSRLIVVVKGLKSATNRK